jgi:hypothetical protein
MKAGLLTRGPNRDNVITLKHPRPGKAALRGGIIMTSHLSEPRVGKPSLRVEIF